VIKSLEAEKKELLDNLMYAKAELANMRRIMENEVKRAELTTLQRVAMKLITFYEDFERVLKGLDEADLPEQLKEALRMLHRELENILSSEGVEKMDVVGKEFNPFEHEAVEVIASPDVSFDTVIEVISPGYRLKDKVLKPPKVKVAKLVEKKEESQT